MSTKLTLSARRAILAARDGGDARALASEHSVSLVTVYAIWSGRIKVERDFGGLADDYLPRPPVGARPVRGFDRRYRLALEPVPAVWMREEAGWRPVKRRGRFGTMRLLDTQGVWHQTVPLAMLVLERAGKKPTLSTDLARFVGAEGDFRPENLEWVSRTKGSVRRGSFHGEPPPGSVAVPGLSERYRLVLGDDPGLVSWRKGAWRRLALLDNGWYTVNFKTENDGRSRCFQLAALVLEATGRPRPTEGEWRPAFSNGDRTDHRPDNVAWERRGARDEVVRTDLASEVPEGSRPVPGLTWWYRYTTEPPAVWSAAQGVEWRRLRPIIRGGDRYSLRTPEGGTRYVSVAGLANGNGRRKEEER